MKCAKKWLALVLAMVLCVSLLAGCGGKATGGETITVTVTVVHGDGSENVLELETDQETLGRALVEEGIVEDNQTTYGLYMLTVDGETVDEGNQEWWCVTKDGEALMTGADETEILDGECYEITFTVGY